MRLKEVTLHEYCQHSHRVLKFEEGLNALVGRNGAGKSNALKGVYAALTGDFGRNAGVKRDNIRQLANEKSDSYVNLVFTHGANTFKVSHSLRNGTAKLRINEEEPVAGTRQVTDRIFKMLGVSPKLIADHVFVEQGDVAAFLSAVDSDRAKLCERLFGTEIASTIYKRIGEHLDALEVPTIGDLRDKCLERIADTEFKIAEIDDKLQAYADLPVDYDPSKDELQEVVARWRALQQVKLDVLRLTEQEERLAKLLASKRTEYERLQADYETLHSYVEVEIKPREAARKEFVSWDAYDRVQHLAKVYDSEEAKAQTEFADNPRPEKPVDFVELQTIPKDAWNLERSELIRTCNVLKQFIATAESGSPECMTCGTPMNELLSSLSARKENLADAQRRLGVLHEQLKRSDLYRQVLAGWNTWYGMWVTSKEGRERRKRDLQFVAKPTRSREELRKYLDELVDMERARDGIKFELDRLGYDKMEGQYENQAKQLKAKCQELAEYDVTESDAAMATKIIGDRTEAWRQLTALTAEQDSLFKMLEDSQKTLAEIELMAQQAVAVRAWEKRLVEMRQVFHRDGAPKISAESNLRILQEDVNDLLFRFDAPYRVSVADNLSFTAHFYRGEKTGIKQPASRLSGGEEVLLALAFRIAVHSRFAGELGLLCMDEPTSGLDQRNLSCVATAFDRLRELCRNTGLQVIMVTHDERLFPLFDRVINLSEDTSD